MKAKNKTRTKYERAQKRVAELRGFYNHLTVYILVNAALLILREKFTIILISKEALGNPEFLDWLNWNTYGTSIVWGIALCIHALRTFSGISFFGRKWEERQIRRFMEEEN
ncbi:2TM domain-containing protein [Flavobacteriaceae bacterium TP-CH-4]|uniref:2TM domain-containing protein n=1 Tax=Pelagihabitans pacificus TaxID=2696054 RepID=A0A967ASX1_9FLAO|nr:2TM domain-containing protein [Pelagihabitans pacificus]NHF59454.1 2TM domain-containing protein [Pelagihabitans pacificus]